MAKILLMDPQRSARRNMKADLVKLGYEIQETDSTQTGLEMAAKGRYNGIILDVQMAIKDDWKVLEELKRNPHTKGTPVMMLAAVRSNQNEATGLRLGATHFISKPWKTDSLALTVRVALREAEERARIERESAPMDIVVPEEERPTAATNTSGFGTAGKLVKLDNVLAGGLSFESMTLIEGSPNTGKSVIYQYLIYGAITSGENVHYFSADHTKTDLMKQMASIDLDIRSSLRARLRPNIKANINDEQLQVHAIKLATSADDPAEFLSALAAEIRQIPPGRTLIILDHISSLAQSCPDRSVLNFFAACRDHYVDGKSLVVVARESAFDPQLLLTLNSLCNNYLKFGAETVGARFVNFLEVQRLNNAELRKDNSFGFMVEPEIGVHVIPVAKIKV